LIPISRSFAADFFLAKRDLGRDLGRLFAFEFDDDRGAAP
jgi:hypothetical protein